MKIRNEDIVQVQVGKDKGKSGKVLKVYPQTGRILVEGINIYKKHSKPRKQGEKGEIVSLSRPFPMEKVQLFCSKCKKGVRFGISRNGKVSERYCKRCKNIL